MAWILTAMKTIAEKTPPMTEKVQMVKKMQYEMAKSFSHLQMDTFCHLKFCPDKRNSITIQIEIYFGSIQKRSNKILGSLCFRRPCVPLLQLPTELLEYLAFLMRPTGLNPVPLSQKD